MAAWHNNKIRTFDPATGIVKVIAGNFYGFAGDGAPACQALFNQPVDLTLGDASFSLAAGGAAVPGTISASGGLISFTPARALGDAPASSRTGPTAEDIAAHFFILVPIRFECLAGQPLARHASDRPTARACEPWD